MALRSIRNNPDPILRKRSREVTEITDREKVLIEDMKETMYANDGVGLAAPQAGVLKRIVVVDVGEGPYILVNPVIIDSKGENIGLEGCLSVNEQPQKVKRPFYVKVQSLNENGENVIIEGEDLFARALCHEIDHLDGVLYIDKVIKER